MATVQEVIVKYKSDVSELQSKAAKLEKTMRGTEKAGEDAGKKITAGFNQAGAAAKDLESKTNPLAEGFENLGKTIIAAFAVEQIVAFGEAAVHAYAESEKAQLQLLAALGGQEDVQKRLIKQADELQGKFGIDNDTIVKQQAFLALQGRTEAQITKTIQAAIQLSAVTGDDLSTSVEKLDKTFELQVGRLGTLDRRFNELTDTQLKNGAAIDLVNEKYAGFAEAGAASVSGQLEIQQRKIDDVTKKIGEQLAPAFVHLKLVGVDALESIIKLLTETSADRMKEQVDSLAAIFDADKSTPTAVLEREREHAKILQAQLESHLKILDSQRGGLTLGNSISVEMAKTQKQIEEQKATQEALTKTIEARAKAELAAKDEAAKKDVESLAALKAKLEELKKNQEKIVDPLGIGKDDNDAIVVQITAIQAKIDEITGEAEKKRAEEAKKLAEKQAAEIAEAFKRQQDKNKQAASDSLEIQLSQLEQSKQAVLGEEERSAQEKLLIEIQFQNERKKLFEDDPVEQAKINAEIAKLSTQLKDQKIKDAEDEASALKKIHDDQAAKDKEDAEKIKAQRKADLEESIRLANEANTLIQSLTSEASQRKIDDLENEKNIRLDSDDEAIKKLQDDRDRDLISLRDFNAQKAVLDAKRKADEDKINKAIRDEKRKQAFIEKDLAIFQATLNLAKAISVALSSAPPPFNAALAAISAVLAGAQLAAIIAQPIPKFARGTKSAPGGLSWIGEEGPEAMFIPQGAKILSNQKTKQYSDFLDAMSDNRLQEHLNRMYIGPALVSQSQKFEVNKQQNFASSIANVIQMAGSGITANDMDWIRRKGTTIKNTDELAKRIAEELAKMMPQSGRRYN